MNPSDIVKECFTAIEQNNYDKAYQYVAEDFIFSGAVPQPVGKHQWLEMHKELSKAFPDWKFNLRVNSEEGDKVHAVVAITATHRRELNLPMPGFNPVPPAGKKVKLPDEKVEIEVKEGKLTKLEVEVVPGGGLMGILFQLGAAPPERA